MQKEQREEDLVSQIVKILLENKNQINEVNFGNIQLVIRKNECYQMLISHSLIVKANENEAK